MTEYVCPMNKGIFRLMSHQLRLDLVAGQRRLGGMLRWMIGSWLDG